MWDRRKQTRRTDVTTERKILNTTNLIKDFGSHPKIVKFVVVQKREKATLKRGLNVF